MMQIDSKGSVKEKQMRLLEPTLSPPPIVLTEAQTRELEVALAELLLTAVTAFLKAEEDGGNDVVEDYA